MAREKEVGDEIYEMANRIAARDYDTWKSTEPDEHDERDETEKIITGLSQDNIRLREINAGLRGELQAALLRAERAERALETLRLNLGKLVAA